MRLFRLIRYSAALLFICVLLTTQSTQKLSLWWIWAVVAVVLMLPEWVSYVRSPTTVKGTDAEGD